MKTSMVKALTFSLIISSSVAVASEGAPVNKIELLLGLVHSKKSKIMAGVALTAGAGWAIKKGIYEPGKNSWNIFNNIRTLRWEHANVIGDNTPYFANSKLGNAILKNPKVATDIFKQEESELKKSFYLNTGKVLATTAIFASASYLAYKKLSNSN